MSRAALRQTMDDRLPSPLELNEHPELAALSILRTGLEVVALALLASYPQSAERCERHGTEEEAYAIALLCQLDALEALLQEYVESIHRAEERQRRQSGAERAASRGPP